MLRKWEERPQGQCSDRENSVVEKTVMGGTKTKRTVIKEKEIRRTMADIEKVTIMEQRRSEAQRPQRYRVEHWGDNVEDYMKEIV